MKSIATPKSVKRFGWLMVLWNLIGVIAFISQQVVGPDEIANLPPESQAIYSAIPLWATLAYGVAVFTGLFGSVFLAFGKKFAFPLLSLSLAGVMTQQFYSFAILDAISLLGPSVTILPTIVLFFAVILVVVSRRGAARGWLH
jgi:hypothetical protein